MGLAQFKDKAREKQRRKLLAARAAEAALAPAQKLAPKPGPKERRAKEGGTPGAKKGSLGTGGGPVPGREEKARRLPSVRRRKLNQRQDAEDLEDEYRLVKKLKKGKLSQVWPSFRREVMCTVKTVRVSDVCQNPSPTGLLLRATPYIM